MVQTRGSLRNGKRPSVPIQVQRDTDSGLDDDSSIPDPGDVSSAYDSGIEPEMPLKKRQKRVINTKHSRKNVTKTSKTATAKRRKGRLELLPSMNLDVLHQILSFLRPVDLLNLSRTTTAFRSLLMQKSSAFIWREARRQIRKLPECPADLSEPQYANLAFYPHCHGCGKRVKSAIWELRIRSCPTCMKNLTISWSEIHRTAGACKDVKNCKWFALPAVDVGYRKPVLCLRSQFEALRRNLCGKKKEERQLIIQRGKALTTAVEAHAKKCRLWEQDVADERVTELEDIRFERNMEIGAWLHSSGFSRDAQYFGVEVRGHPVFHEAKPLTPRSWIRVRSILTNRIHELRAKNMDAFVYPTRRNILKTACQQYMRGRFSQSGSTEPMPGWGFLASLKVFDDIIKAPPETPFKDDMFSSAFAKLPEILPPLRMKVELKLSALCMLPASSKVTSGDHNFVLRRLGLASSFFLCGNALVVYPQVSHLVFSKLEALTARENISVLEMDSWDIGLGLRISRYQVAAEIVSLCGLDPTIATPDDMDAKNVLIRCSQCHPKTTHAMTWRYAVMHAHSLGHGDCLCVAQEGETPLRVEEDVELMIGELI